MSSSRSKVEYLAKKYALETDRGPKKKKEKKRSKYDGIEADSNATGRRHRDLRLFDADHLDNLNVATSVGRFHPEDDTDEEGGEEEDAPVVVESSELIDPDSRSKHVPRGAWEVQSLDAVDGGEKRSPSAQNERVRRRHDSSSDDDDPPPRKRHDSEDSGSRLPSQQDSRRRRHDTDSDDSSIQKKPEKVTSRPKKRYDSSDTDSSGNRRRRRKRYDTSDDSDDEAKGRERMSSGHRSGIQTGKDFSRRENRLQQTKREVTQAFVERHGGTGETVHRDRTSGTAIDAKQQTAKGETKVVLSAEEQRKLNIGQAQLEQEAQRKREFAALQETLFARSKDDADRDAMLKGVIHPDDPMAAYAMEQKQQQKNVNIRGEDSANVTTRPVYKGPPAKPNRFGIPPGYRWDARDRGNGFEDKVLAQKYNAQHQKEKAYRYSSADM